MKRRNIIIILMAALIAIPILWIVYSAVSNSIITSRWLQAPHPSGERIQTGNTSLFMRVKGQGTPAVIIQTGLGSTSLEWWHIQDRLAEDATVITYDRNAYGWSLSSGTPATAENVTTNLRAILKKKGTRGPYILVGHDIGALYTQHFARKHPGEVAGVVMINPITTEYGLLKEELPRVFYQNLIRRTPKLRIAGLAADAGIMRSLRILVNENIPCDVLDDVISHYSRGDVYDAMIQEYGSSLNTSIQQVQDAGPFPSRPLTILRYSEKDYRNRLYKFQMSWDEARMVNRVYSTIFRKAAGLSPRGTLRQSQKGLHYLHLDDPQLVIESIQKQLRLSR